MENCGRANFVKWLVRLRCNSGTLCSEIKDTTWAASAALMREARNAYRIFLGTAKFEYLGELRLALRWISENKILNV